MKRAVFLGLGSVVIIIATQGCGAIADSDSSFSAQQMSDVAAEVPGAPIVLPVSIPDGYQWAGVGEEQGDGRHVWARVVQFTGGENDPLVEICARKVEQTQGCESDTDLVIERKWLDYRVFISIETGSIPEISSSDSEFWSKVKLSTDYQSVSWLE